MIRALAAVAVLAGGVRGARAAGDDDVLRARMPELRRCYQTVLGRDDPGPDVLVSFTIARDGHTRKVAVTRGLSDRFDACVQQFVMSWAFAPRASEVRRGFRIHLVAS